MPSFCPRHHQYQNTSLSASSRTQRSNIKASVFSLPSSTLQLCPYQQPGKGLGNQRPAEQLPALLLRVVLPSSRCHWRLTLAQFLVLFFGCCHPGWESAKPSYVVCSAPHSLSVACTGLPTTEGDRLSWSWRASSRGGEAGAAPGCHLANTAVPFLPGFMPPSLSA